MVGTEEAQLGVGQNTGLIVKTTRDHPIEVSHNSHEAVVVNPNKDVACNGNLNVTGSNGIHVYGAGTRLRTIQPSYINLC